MVIRVSKGDAAMNEVESGKKQKAAVFKDDEYLNFFYDAAGYREFCEGLAKLLPSYEMKEYPTPDKSDDPDQDN